MVNAALKMEDYLSVQELRVLFDCFQPESDMWMPVSTAQSVLTAPSEENNSEEEHKRTTKIKHKRTKAAH
jgi:hypothetical protein